MSSASTRRGFGARRPWPKAGVNANSVDEQFASLQGNEDAAEVDARLAALKAAK